MKLIQREEYYLRLSLLIRQVAVLVVLFQVCRLIFFIINFNFFNPFKFEYEVNSFFYGTQYDLSAIIKYNCLYILCVLLPGTTLFRKTNYRKSINILFIGLNTAALIISLSDCEYFKYANKRTTYEFIYFLRTMNMELFKLIPVYLIQYWYLLILLLAMLIILVRFRFTKNHSQSGELKQSSPFTRIFFTVSMLILMFFLSRGFSKSPLRSSDCERITPVEYNVLITNTPFVLIEYQLLNTGEYKGLVNLKMIDPERSYASSSPFRPLNVVIIILESFSKEYIGSLNGNQGATPFLDSLIQQGYLCSSAYANGRTSLQALPAILCGEPSLGEAPLVLKTGRIRDMNSIAEILSSKGYGTSFFYGARNGNLGINNFARDAGFQHYYGMDEYNSGGKESAWGVFDDEFLGFAANTMKTYHKPFLSCILTLSSHSPFEIPGKYKDKFKEQPNPQLRSIAYADYSLAQFFRQVSHYCWYSNTLFVISADHASCSYSSSYNTRNGAYAIPILYFCPGDSLLKGKNHQVTQQCDILPSVLDYLHYPKTFESVGSSIFSPKGQHFAIMKFQDQFQYIDDEFILNMSENGSLTSAYKMKGGNIFPVDLTATNNKKQEAEISNAEDNLKSVVNYSLR
ncbi:MAG: LTA synthase family protein [Bacteroidetes bacterium]|nr:LTA synthase family protein [Bacteroidota bacterium]